MAVEVTDKPWMPCDVFQVRHGESEGNVALNAAKVDWIELEASGESGIPNCAVLQYSRDDEQGTVRRRFSRVRFIDPYTDRAADWAADWADIARPRLSDGELLASVDPADTPRFGDRPLDPSVSRR